MHTFGQRHLAGTFDNKTKLMFDVSFLILLIFEIGTLMIYLYFFRIPEKCARRGLRGDRAALAVDAAETTPLPSDQFLSRRLQIVYNGRGRGLPWLLQAHRSWRERANVTVTHSRRPRGAVDFLERT